jgi:hypothetical protein
MVGRSDGCHLLGLRGVEIVEERRVVEGRVCWQAERAARLLGLLLELGAHLLDILWTWMAEVRTRVQRRRTNCDLQHLLLAGPSLREIKVQRANVLPTPNQALPHALALPCCHNLFHFPTLFTTCCS